MFLRPKIGDVLVGGGGAFAEVVDVTEAFVVLMPRTESGERRGKPWTLPHSFCESKACGWEHFRRAD